MIELKIISIYENKNVRDTKIFSEENSELLAKRFDIASTINSLISKRDIRKIEIVKEGLDEEG